MHIVWVLDGIEGSEAAGYTSTLASHRYRALMPAQALRDKGHRVSFVPANTWQWRSDDRPDAVVVGKLLAGSDARRYREVSERVLGQVEQVVRAGVVVLADFNDDHFDHPLMGGYWRRLSQLCSLCVAGSESMAERVAGYTQRPTFVVGDPIASPQTEPRAFRLAPGLAGWLGRLLPGGSQQRLKLVWYGNPVNWPAMQQWAELLPALAQSQPLVLWLVTSPNEAIQNYVKAFNARHAPAMLAEWVEWDEQTQWDVVRDADIVLLPSDPSDPKKSVKTSNRLIDAMNMGRAVVASPLPSYQAFSEHVRLTNHPVEGIRWWLEQTHTKCLQLLQQAQGAVRAVAGLPLVAETWLRAVAAAKRADPTQFVSLGTDNSPEEAERLSSSSLVPVRLNLGCGDKILPGYVNVDLAGNWSGKMPDVVADITSTLPFDDNFADEVHAYHVLEHLTRWKVEDCLKEWVRVLKPGGMLVLEMPCLDKIMQIYAHYAQRGEVPPPRLTIWALYGDPGYRVPAMMHQWCYSMQELTDVLSSIGMVNIRSEKPQTHIEIRDMRQVSFKPLISRASLSV